MRKTARNLFKNIFFYQATKKSAVYIDDEQKIEMYKYMQREDKKPVSAKFYSFLVDPDNFN